VGPSVIAGLGTGTVAACLGWEQLLRVWPLLLVPLLFARFRVVATLVTFGCLLMIITVAQINSTLAVIVSPFEAQYGEAILYNQAARLLRGEPLYQALDRPPFTVVAYTPVYYWLAAGLRAALGPGFGPGRSLSLLAGLAAASLVGYIVARQARDRWAGVFAARLFLALGLPWVYPRSDLFSRDDLFTLAGSNFLADLTPLYPWLAFYKEDILGVALSLGAIATLVSGITPRRLVLGGTLAGLAILTKQTMFAASLAGLVWLWRRDRNAAVLYGGTGLGIVVGVCTALEITTRAFLENAVLANVNPMSLEVLVSNLAMLVRFQAGPVAVAGLYVLGRARISRRGDELPTYFWMATLLPLVGLAKAGSNHNHWTEFAAATAVLATLGLWNTLGQLQASPLRAMLPVVLLGATLLAVTPLVGGAARIRPASVPQPDPNYVREYNALIEQVRSERGAVLASSLDVVALADRAILLEPYIFSILYSQGRWDPDPLIRRICSRQIGLLVFYNPLEHGTGQYHGYAFWPLPVLTALQQTMTLEASRGGRFLYVPRSSTAGVDGPTVSSNQVCAD
jgi:hypothetical protein